MTPKEKADELFRKMYETHSVSPSDITKYFAKKCALIAVDEIINILNYDIRDIDVRGNILLDLIDYWREVKQEIEKI